jgi:predicted secreted protein
METIEIKAGKSSIIGLPSLAAAGYLWNYEVDRKEFVSVSEDRSSLPPDILKAGESLPEKFLIKAIQPGTAKVIFSQKRSWEQNKAAVAILIFTVVVS